MEDQYTLKSSLEKVGSPRVLVIGDIILDRYTWGSVSRISQEAPIPVLRVSREENRLGGAANVMTNLATLGAKVSACGVIGQDVPGENVLQICQELGIETRGIFRQAGYATILKNRMLAGQHHLLRMDFDPPEGWQPSVEPEILEFLAQELPQVALVLVSDYGKGLLTPPILAKIRHLSQQHGLPVVIDPRPIADYQVYQGGTLIKPNRKEAEQIVGFPLRSPESILRAAQAIKDKAHMENVLISLDRDGLLLYQDAEHYTLFEAEAHEVFDVVGAGDMVASVMAYMMAGGAPLEHAAFWANLAAGMEVMQVGVIPFSKTELIQKLEMGHGSKKLVTLEQLLKHLQPQSAPIVFTNGYFDNISAGHLKFLQQLQQFKGIKIVAINSDSSILSQKGSLPLLNETDRALLLASIEVVDWVVIFSERDASALIRQLRPKIVVKGSRYRDQRIAEQATIEDIGAVVHYLTEY